MNGLHAKFLGSKLETEKFKNHLKDYRAASMTKTMRANFKLLKVDPNKSKHIKSGRDSGGLLIFA